MRRVSNGWWDKEGRIETVLEILTRYRTTAEAIGEINAALSRPILYTSLTSMLRRRGYSVLDYLGTALRRPDPVAPRSATQSQAHAAPVSKPRPTPRAQFKTVPEDTDPNLEVVRAVQKLQKKHGTVTLESLCDSLGVSPSEGRARAAAAQDAGLDLAISNDSILFGVEEAPETKTIDLGIDPGEWHTVMVTGDLHAGCKYCQISDFQYFIKYGYDLGARIVLMTGDMLQGKLRHPGFEFELKYHGFDDQCEELLDILPQMPDLQYHFITGNHDEKSYHASAGFRPGQAIVERAAARGRDDLHYLGSTRGHVRLHREGEPEDSAVKIELWHPGGGRTYSLSYRGQNKVRDTHPAHLPDILLIGHLHAQGQFTFHGVRTIMTGSWQGGGSDFSKSMSGDPTLGGTILWVRKSNSRYRWIREETVEVQPDPIQWFEVNT